MDHHSDTHLVIDSVCSIEGATDMLLAYAINGFILTVICHNKSFGTNELTTLSAYSSALFQEMAFFAAFHP
jgi:hypothetical protein